MVLNYLLAYVPICSFWAFLSSSHELFFHVVKYAQLFVFELLLYNQIKKSGPSLAHTHFG